MMSRYEIAEKIGRGKYSDVYKAMRVGGKEEQDRWSVLKVLKPGIAVIIQSGSQKYEGRSKSSRP